MSIAEAPQATSIKPNVRKLNLGCGKDHRVEFGWTNADIDPSVQPDVVCDLNRALPWHEHHWHEIELCHVLEHVTHWRQLIDETFRILRPWGKLTVRVPDFEYAIKAYLTGEKPESRFTFRHDAPADPIDWRHLIYGHWTDTLPGRGHVMAFSWLTDRDNDLFDILDGAGFKSIKRVNRGFNWEIWVEGYKP